MPRGFVFARYLSDNGVPYALRVDADQAQDPARGWTFTNIGQLHLLPREFRPRRVFGYNAVSGRTGSTIVARVDAPLWTGVTKTFTVEANDNTIDTMTVIRSLQEKETIPR